MSPEIDVRKLEVFNRISKEGSRTVADSLGQLTGVDASIEVAKINFLHVDDVKTHIGDETRVGIHVQLTEPPHGYVLFLLGPADSKKLAGLMLPGGGDDDADGFSGMERSAIQEVGNILTSGYIDGLANVLETTIDMGTPQFTYGPANGSVQEMGGWPDEDLVFVLDSRITADGEDIDLTVYTFPKLHSLVDLVQQIDLDTDVREETVADDVVDG